MPAHHPRLSIAGPLLRGGGELHIIGSHDVTTLPDPDGAIHRLLELTDGSRSRAQLCAELASERPNLDEDDVEAALAELESLGLLDDAGPSRARMLAGRALYR
jgi:hypothetical protein